MAREQFQTLTEPMYYILLALLKECCGVDIMDRVLVLSDNRVRVGPGTLYTILSRFEQNGLIRLTEEQGRRKSYLITEEGKKMLENEVLRLQKMLQDSKKVLE